MTFVRRDDGQFEQWQQLVEQAKRYQVQNLEPAMPRLEPRRKLEEATAKWLKKFEFLELEWL